MTVTIDVKIEDGQVRQLLARLQQKLGNLSPVMKVIGQVVRTSVVRNFEMGGRPRRWQQAQVRTFYSQFMSKSKKNQAYTQKGTLTAAFNRYLAGKKTLIGKGFAGGLLGSINVRASANAVAVGTNKKYAAIHQFGGTTAAHEIKPVRKKALAWPTGGHPVKSVKHPGSKIPARPFLMVQPEDWTEIKAAINDYLTGA